MEIFRDAAEGPHAGYRESTEVSSLPFLLVKVSVSFLVSNRMD